MADKTTQHSNESHPAVVEALARRESFVRLFAQHERMVHGFILALLPRWNDANEVFQETSLVLWRKFDQFESGTNFLRWACRVAEFEVRRFRQRARRDKLAFSDAILEGIAQTRLEESDLLAQREQALSDCLAKLGATDRQLLTARYADNTPGREIAATRGQQVESVYKALQRVRAALYACINRALAQQERE